MTTAWPSSVPVCLGLSYPWQESPPPPTHTQKEHLGLPLATTSTDGFILFLWLAGVSKHQPFPTTCPDSPKTFVCW